MKDTNKSRGNSQSKPKSSKNKPGPLDDIGRGVKKVAGAIDRGVRKNPSNKGGFSNLDKMLGRPTEERSFTKIPGDVIKGTSFVVRKLTPLPDMKKSTKGKNK